MNLRQFFTTQTWWGKIIGAIMGFLMAGSVGALIGILVGNLFDRGLVDHFSRPYWYYHSESRHKVQSIFFESTFLVMGHLAKTDGRVSEQEIKQATALMREMRLSAAQKKEARCLFNEGKKKSFDLKGNLARLKKALYDNPELLKLFVDIQYSAAHIDGLTENKMESMNIILLYLDFAPLHQQHRFYEDFNYNYHGSSRHNSRSQRSYSQSNHQYSYTQKDQLSQAYAMLEVKKTATKQEVKKAYRRLMSKNHPDKLIAQGLPEEMIKIATDKTQKISNAYDLISKSKGW